MYPKQIMLGSASFLLLISYLDWYLQKKLKKCIWQTARWYSP